MALRCWRVDYNDIRPHSKGQVINRQRLRRGEIASFFSSIEPCLVGIEACATAHHWAREIRRFGHEVRLIPPAYVKPYVRRGANDAADAAAICEAVTRPNMRFVPIKSVESQGFLMLHRARGLLVRQRTMTACAVRAHFAEFGNIVGQGRQRVDSLADLLDDEALARCRLSVSCWRSSSEHYYLDLGFLPEIVRYFSIGGREQLLGALGPENSPLPLIRCQPRH